MNKLRILEKIAESGVVAVIRADSKEQGIKIVEAVNKGGIRAVEITMTVPGAVDIIKELTGHYKNEDIVIGAGTVLDSETARACIIAGAKYIVSPGFDKDTCQLCNRYQIPYMPGCVTPTEIITALEAGADIIKIFPGSIVGPSYIKAIKGPIPQAPLMPTGGVDIHNVVEWIKNGCVAVGVGGSLTIGAKSGDYELVTKTAQQFIEQVNLARMSL